MNGSVVIAKIAGIESIANMTSVVSTTTRTANSGVAISLPAWRTKNFWPWYSSVIGTDRRTSRSTMLLLGVHRVALRAPHPDAREQEQQAEAVDQEVERVEQRRAGGDEDRAEHDGAHDAPEQDAVLVLLGHGEVPEQHREQEDVVHRERLLDEVAGEVLAAGLGASRVANTTAPKARPSVIQTTLQAAASRSDTSCASRWKTNRSSASMPTTTTPSTTQRDEIG